MKRQFIHIIIGVLLAMAVTECAWGQNTLTIHDGTTTNSYVPFYGLWVDDYTRTEIIYPADELSIMTGGIINSITFYKSSTSTSSWGAASFQIHLKEVTETSLSNYISIDGATLVYSGMIDASGGERTVTITFNTPYQYNGGNLLFSVYQTTEGSYSSAYWYGENVTGMSASGYNSSNASSAAFNQRNFIPKTTFEYTPDPSVCQKPNNLIISNITTNSATISWYGNATSYNIRTNCKRYNFDTGFQGWTTIDADGDGYDWVLGSNVGGVYLVDGASLSGDGHNSSIDLVTSGSYENVNTTALTPDNYLVSPLIQFGSGSKISFWACAQDINWQSEHFGIAISTNGNINPNDFTTIAYCTFPENMTREQSNWKYYEVDLSTYSGQGYVAIRHFDCSDEFMLNIDDITICENGSIIIENVTSPYTITNLIPETEYTYLIESDCGNGNLSTLTSINFTTTYLPLQFLDIVEEPVCWDFEDIELLTMPNKWTNEGDSDWTVGIGDYSGSTTGAHSGGRNILITHTNRNDITYLCLPLMDLSNIDHGDISFYFINRSWAGDIDELDVCYRINSGNWTSLLANTITDAHSSWTEQNVNLVPAMFTNNVQIGFKFKDNYGYGVGLDDICLELYDVQNHLLPITLRYFNATPRSDGKNILKWSTAYESQNSNFEIYRTRDVLFNQWESVVTLWQGITDKPRGDTYMWLDEQPYDTTYYMLVQNDLDGGFETFRSEMVVCIQQHKRGCIEPSVTCYGVPQASGGSEPCEVYVQNVLGQLVEEFTLQPYQTHDIAPNVSGAYLVTFVYQHNGQTYKLTEKVICM